MAVLGRRGLAGKRRLGKAADADVDREQPARQRLLGEVLRRDVLQLARGGDVEPIHVRPAERAGGDERAWHLDLALDAPVWRIAHDAGAPVLRAPETAFLVHRGAIGMSYALCEVAARTDRSALDVIGIGANGEVGGVREVHGAIVRAPGQAIGVPYAGLGRRELTVRIEAIEDADRTAGGIMLGANPETGAAGAAAV